MNIKEIYNKYREKYIHMFGRSFYHDIVMLFFISAFFLILISILLILIFRVNVSTGDIPLSYSVIYGVTSLGSWVNLYFYLLAYTFLGVLNLFVGWAFFEKERLISYLLGFVNIIIGILFIITIFNLTALVV
jgi:hypothetical protein